MLALWVKALHIVAVFAWMAGLFYLPRLFVYHTRQELGSDSDRLFIHMEDRLVKVIMRPAGVVTLLAGVVLVGVSGFSWGDGWLSAKLLGVLGLVIYHSSLERYAFEFRHGRRLRSERFFRVVNEVPTVLLVWIVIWVVVKPSI
ncbi:MAG: protoporphyrinogen oxidase HemJ [Alphaproteobacteria bacterium]|nr:protoporphyrinogen oxidase HemJ [Alphaproteobacteria bacterium]